MNELNRKLLAITLALSIILLATPMLGTVMAGKGQNKLDYEGTFQLGGYTVESRFVPAPPPDANVQFITLTNPVVIIFTLEIDGIIYYPNFDAEMLIIRNLNNPDFRLVKATETYTFDGVDGSLVISTTGRTNNMGTPEQEDIVNVEGHGTGYFEGVKISAKGYCPIGDPTLKIHEGTIIGWQGLPS